MTKSEQVSVMGSSIQAEPKSIEYLRNNGPKECQDDMGNYKRRVIPGFG